MSILQLRTSPHGVSYSLVRAQSRLGNLDDDLPDSLPADEVLLRLLHALRRERILGVDPDLERAVRDQLAEFRGVPPAFFGGVDVVAHPFVRESADSPQG